MQAPYVALGVLGTVAGAAYLLRQHPAGTVGKWDKAPDFAELNRDMDIATQYPKPKWSARRGEVEVKSTLHGVKPAVPTKPMVFADGEQGYLQAQSARVIPQMRSQISSRVVDDRVLEQKPPSVINNDGGFIDRLLGKEAIADPAPIRAGSESIRSTDISGVKQAVLNPMVPIAGNIRDFGSNVEREVEREATTITEKVGEFFSGLKQKATDALEATTVSTGAAPTAPLTAQSVISRDTVTQAVAEAESDPRLLRGLGFQAPQQDVVPGKSLISDEDQSVPLPSCGGNSFTGDVQSSILGNIRSEGTAVAADGTTGLSAADNASLTVGGILPKNRGDVDRRVVPSRASQFDEYLVKGREALPSGMGKGQDYDSRLQTELARQHATEVGRAQAADATAAPSFREYRGGWFGHGGAPLRSVPAGTGEQYPQHHGAAIDNSVDRDIFGFPGLGPGIESPHRK